MCHVRHVGTECRAGLCSLSLSLLENVTGQSTFDYFSNVNDSPVFLSFSPP